MSQHPCDLVGDREAEPQAPLLVVVDLIEPTEFLEYFLPFFFGDATARIPYFNAQFGSSAAASQQHPSTSRVAYRVGKEVLQHPSQSLGIRDNVEVAVDGSQTQ